MEIVRIQQNNYNANFKAKPKYRGSKNLWHGVKQWERFRTIAKRIGRAGDVVNLHISEPFQDKAGNFYRNLKISANLYNLGDRTFCEEKMLCDSQKDIIDLDKARSFFTDNLEQISWKQSYDLQKDAIQKLKEMPYANFEIRDAVGWENYINEVSNSNDYARVSAPHFIADIAHKAESYISKKGVDVENAIQKAINELTKSRVYDAKSFSMDLIIREVHEFWAKGSQDYDVLLRIAEKHDLGKNVQIFDIAAWLEYINENLSTKEGYLALKYMTEFANIVEALIDEHTIPLDSAAIEAFERLRKNNAYAKLDNQKKKEILKQLDSFWKFGKYGSSTDRVGGKNGKGLVSFLEDCKLLPKDDDTKHLKTIISMQ